MNNQRTLNAAAAGLSLIAAILAFAGSRSKLLGRVSAIAGLLGTAAWTAAAYQDYCSGELDQPTA